MKQCDFCDGGCDTRCKFKQVEEDKQFRERVWFGMSCISLFVLTFVIDNTAEPWAILGAGAALLVSFGIFFWEKS